MRHYKMYRREVEQWEKDVEVRIIARARDLPLPVLPRLQTSGGAGRHHVFENEMEQWKKEFDAYKLARDKHLPLPSPLNVPMGFVDTTPKEC